MKTNGLDDLFLSASVDLTQRLSRRKLLGFLGKLSAGVTFFGMLGRNAAARLAPEAEVPQDVLPCTTDPNYAASGWVCSGYGQGQGCGNCMLTDSELSDAGKPELRGCPAGSQFTGAWTCCVPCKDPGNAGKGIFVTYNDCCGNLDPKRCKGCKADQRIPRKPFKVKVTAKGPYSTYLECDQSGGSAHSWCSEGSILCTRVQTTYACCDTVTPGKPCNFGS